MMLNQGRHMKALTKAAGIVGLALAAAQAGLGAQDSLTAAKDQYASAAYEDALSTLTRLTGSGGAAPDIARQVDEYRAFCRTCASGSYRRSSVSDSGQPGLRSTKRTRPPPNRSWWKRD
jgi:hypothetical protein